MSFDGHFNRWKESLPDEVASHLSNTGRIAKLGPDGQPADQPDQLRADPQDPQSITRHRNKADEPDPRIGAISDTWQEIDDAEARFATRRRGRRLLLAGAVGAVAAGYALIDLALHHAPSHWIHEQTGETVAWLQQLWHKLDKE